MSAMTSDRQQLIGAKTVQVSKPGCRVWVCPVFEGKNVKKDLEELFGPFLHLDLIRGTDYAFINFKDESDANKAISRSGIFFSAGKCRVRVRKAEPRPSQRTGSPRVVRRAGVDDASHHIEVLVRNLPLQVTTEDLEQLFKFQVRRPRISYAGNVQVGYMAFGSMDDVDLALALSGKTKYGEKVTVELDRRSERDSGIGSPRSSVTGKISPSVSLIAKDSKTCVVLTGLAPDVSAEDVLKFLGGVAAQKEGKGIILDCGSPEQKHLTLLRSGIRINGSRATIRHVDLANTDNKSPEQSPHHDICDISFTVYVANLPMGLSVDDINQLFPLNIEEPKLVQNKINQYAFVDFGTWKDATDAVKRNGNILIHGQKVYVEWGGMFRSRDCRICGYEGHHEENCKERKR